MASSVGELTVRMSVVSFDDSVSLECDRVECANHVTGTFKCNLKSVALDKDGICKHYVDNCTDV